MYFVWVYMELIGVKNKQIRQQPLRGSRDLFLPHSHSFHMNPEKDTHLNKDK